MPDQLAFYRFAGTHSEIGRQYGEACSKVIGRHLELALDKLAGAGIGRDLALQTALAYRPFVKEHAAFLDDEIVGMAQGAALSVAEAYLLQLRAEVFADVLGDPAAESECTTFALEPSATLTGEVLAGQNADLPAIYEELMIVVDFAPTEGRRILMAVPAGQVSYIGINDSGMAVFANFLHCEGWTRGFPRYLLSRFALEFPDSESAIAALRTLPRASSRNILIVDAAGTAVDFENTPTRDAVIRPRDGVLAHSNHYVAEPLIDEERTPELYLHNSRVRLARIEELIRAEEGEITVAAMARIMRDRRDAPHTLSVEARDLPDDAGPPEGHYVTVCSVIAEPAERRLWITAGAPSRSTYHPYTMVGAATPVQL
ncbi:C45 family autoproteolytic acyltransferase/hydrolase [Microbacterium koreense]|uniref:C45 family autoproteolytic acyltransferase/hydrolase n=1 Tax=Microbacterium koreense TaxID=323761 RepID=A0ABW2ZQE0_9MICO